MRFLVPTVLTLTSLASAQVSINEIRVGEVGPDLNEYFELRVAPGTSLAGLTYVMIGSNAVDGSGVIEVAVPLPAIVPTDPFYLVAESTMTLATPDHVAVLGFVDQSNSTHFLVSGFAGSVGQDLDVGDDGILESTPWSQIVDRMVFSTGFDTTMLTYGGPWVGGDGIPSQHTLHTARLYSGWWIMPDDFSEDTPGEDNGTGPVYELLCWPANPNSTGAPADLFAHTSAAAGSGLHLEVSGGREGTIGYMLMGTGDGSANPVQISSGLFCLSMASGQQMGHYNIAQTDMNSIGMFDANGRLQNLAGTSSTGSGFDVPAKLPLTGAPLIQAGQTYYFQCWYRDISAAPNSNFTNMLKVSF